jgi:hypothetical protein
MGRRSPETMVKRAREQALREKRELKQAKKDARAAERLKGPEDAEDGIETEALEGDDVEADADPEEGPET